MKNRADIENGRAIYRLYDAATETMHYADTERGTTIELAWGVGGEGVMNYLVTYPNGDTLEINGSYATHIVRGLVDLKN